MMQVSVENPSFPCFLEEVQDNCKTSVKQAEISVPYKNKSAIFIAGTDLNTKGDTYGFG